MIRSLGLVLAIVVVVFFLARPPTSDSAPIRPVDPAGDVTAFTEVARGVPVPGPITGWRSTVSDYDSEQRILRVGWVTPAGTYAEYAASAAPAPLFVRDLTGSAPPGQTVSAGGVEWTSYRSDDGVSLVRRVGTSTIVLGTLRDTASLDDLRLLAAALRP
jgi:hypothetical protein